MRQAHTRLAAGTAAAVWLWCRAAEVAWQALTAARQLMRQRRNCQRAACVYNTTAGANGAAGGANQETAAAWQIDRKFTYASQMQANI